MAQNLKVRSLLATMLGLPADRLQADTSLRSLDNSLGAMRLRLGLKRIGIALSTQKVPATFGQFESSLGSGAALPVSASSDVATLQPVSAARTNNLRIGHDIQDIQSLPDTTDYWSHEFYLGCFSRAELAYAVVFGEPKEHLAGFWAAKEALKKCEPSFIDADLTRLTVAHNADGRPYFFFDQPSGGFPLSYSVSISHAGNTASAVVLPSGGPGI